MDSQYFAEGLTVVDDEIYQLTYKEKVFLKWDILEGNKLELQQTS